MALNGPILRTTFQIKTNFCKRFLTFSFISFVALSGVEEYPVKPIEIPRLMQVLNHPATEDGANYNLPHEGRAL
jgi:hypothetical protein